MPKLFMLEIKDVIRPRKSVEKCAELFCCFKIETLAFNPFGGLLDFFPGYVFFSQSANMPMTC